MLASAPAWVAPILQEALLDIIGGGRPPESWHDALLVLIPKDVDVTIPASRFRPLALGNTMAK
eukprot:2294648-Amphidinium_carterae.1